MRRWLAIAALLPGMAAAGNFCAVTAGGANCSFPDLGSCQQALVGMGGQCVVNPQALPQPIAPIQPAPRMQYQPPAQIQYPNMADSFARGQQQALEAARTREQVRLLQAQRAAIESAPAQKRPMTNDGYWVMYRCPDAAGQMQYSGVPVKGCVVEFVEAY